MAFRANSFKFLWKKENSKPPTMPFRIVACTFPDNLSRNSCIQWPERNKTDTHTCLVPLDCSRICVTLDIFCHKRYFSSLLLLFSFILLVKSFSKSFSTSSLAQNRIIAKTSCVSASLSKRWHTISSREVFCQLIYYIGILKLSSTLFASVSPFFLTVNNSF